MALFATALFVVTTASGETTHTYPVSLTISADRTGHLINVQVLPGKDDLVKAVTPYAGEFHASSPKRIRGKRVYAEVLSYHLPSRPVVCLAARSRTVTAP